jgi:hypothetical protein
MYSEWEDKNGVRSNLLTQATIIFTSRTRMSRPERNSNSFLLDVRLWQKSINQNIFRNLLFKRSNRSLSNGFFVYT